MLIILFSSLGHRPTLVFTTTDFRTSLGRHSSQNPATDYKVKEPVMDRVPVMDTYREIL